ncbi:hypothetical protein HYALB_00011431 [Hymenoscyphus albidus]|uniref:Glycosylphosphatidylinositol anchor biosynthesis protein 11 n=1 Tax=Hymenoscyphus albidus TaxID=595503 RepID=A0A9N9Q8S8_9HELO|nr:hypothetical protein HYALB_00011431 [Hymenoscyphus albidus]
MPLIDPVTMSATTKTTPAGTPPVKPSLPVELLPNDLARIISQAHPVVLLAGFYIRFPALVENPAATLLSSLLLVSLVQIGYVILCLPPTGQSIKPAKKVIGAKKTNDGTTPVARPLTAFFALIMSLASIPLLTALQILFGAPISTHLLHTILTSSHVALLVMFPLVYVHGADGKKWREIASFYSPMDEVFGGAVGCFLGAWLGAVPIPLDWDREWQKWPVTIVTGAYAGYMVGKMAGGWLVKGRRIELS